MKCETCNDEHDGSYGSGRFCSSICARSFSTKNKRDNINEKVSKRLTGKSLSDEHKAKLKVILDKARESAGSVESRAKISDGLRKRGAVKAADRLWNWAWDDLSYKYKKKKVLIEQDHKCLICGLSDEWQGKPLKLHFDHINGNHADNRRENVRYLCPNCHSQTATYCGRNIAYQKEMAS